jgi:glutamate---cysteine ligase / carboxylate-amine ligase
MHINLPFRGDVEFGQLHAAMRLILPILPALAASSPIVEGKVTGLYDTRVNVYRSNARRVPLVSGLVIPERVFTRADYEDKLLQKIYDAMAPLDPQGVLRHEWANARGCIARFERMAIEIRLLDLQECPAADIAIARCVVGVLKQLVSEKWCNGETQRAFNEERLLPILIASTHDGDQANIVDREYLAALGYDKPGPVRALELWAHLISGLEGSEGGLAEWRAPLDVILNEGCLARRILTATGQTPSREQLHAVYGELAGCLERGESFRARA